MHININGLISTSSITQQRGIRQGDSISPLLSNIAFDPFPRYIQQDPQLTSFNLYTEAPPPLPDTSTDDILDSMQQLFPNSDDPSIIHDGSGPQAAAPIAPLAVKILVYADDTLVYLHNRHDFHRLQAAITVYMKVSNALLNYHKTIATSLSGKPSATWLALFTAHSMTA